MSTEKKSAAQFAANYPQVLEDGFFGPVTISNIGTFDERDIINLRLRTEKSGDNNASISFPSDWNKKEVFHPGMRVNVEIVNGYVKKISEAIAKSVHAKAKVSASQVNEEILEADENTEAGDLVDEALKGAAASTTQKVVIAANNTDDLPF